MEITWTPQNARYVEVAPAPEDMQPIRQGDLIYTCGELRPEESGDVLRGYRWNSPSMDQQWRKRRVAKTLLGISDEAFTPSSSSDKLIVLRVQTGGLAFLPLPRACQLSLFSYGSFVLVEEAIEEQPLAGRRGQQAGGALAEPLLRPWSKPDLLLCTKGEPDRDALEQVRRPALDCFRLPPNGDFYRCDGNFFESKLTQEREEKYRIRMLDYAKAWIYCILQQPELQRKQNSEIAAIMGRLACWWIDLLRRRPHVLPAGSVCLGVVRGHFEDRHALAVELTRSTWSKNPVRQIW
eukprot:g72109.t1